MTRILLLAGVTLLGLATSQPGRAQGAPDGATRDIIERLRPTEPQMRGIRMPGTDSGTATPAPAQPHSPVPGAPDAMPAAPATPARTTTAPPGIAAISLTVNFASASHTLSPQAAAALASLGRALASPELLPFRFRIEGHTDSVGDSAQNMALSLRRAEAVREYLVRGFAIAPARLVAEGFGEEQLLIATPDNKPEARNRRVQIVNLGN